MTHPSSTPPAPGTPRPYHFPAHYRHRLSCGARVVVAPLDKYPLVTLCAVFHRAGAQDDPAGQEGLAQLTAAMLLEGSETRNGAALAEYFESLGSSLTTSADWDATMVGFTAQPSKLDAAVDAVRDVLRAPAFPELDLARLRADQRADRLQIIADPRSLADSAFSWSCYGEHSRYRRPVDGTAATVSAVTRQDVERFWREQFGPTALTLIVAGDISTTRAITIAEELCSGWSSATPPVADRSAVPRYPGRRTTLVAKPGAAQAEVRIGHVGVPRSHPSYFPLTVMNAVLGGLFSSRINLNLRERHGYTYGASSGFDWRAGPGPWAVSTAVKTEVCTAAVREIFAEVERIRAVPITPDELELAASYMVGVFPLRFETTAAVAAALATQASLSLPDDYFDTYRTRMSEVSPGDVLDVARAHLDPASMQIVVAGDPDLLSADLAADAGEGLILLGPEAVEEAA